MHPQLLLMKYSSQNTWEWVKNEQQWLNNCYMYTVPVNPQTRVSVNAQGAFIQRNMIHLFGVFIPVSAFSHHWQKLCRRSEIRLIWCCFVYWMQLYYLCGNNWNIDEMKRIFHSPRQLWTNCTSNLVESTNGVFCPITSENLSFHWT